MDDRSFDLCKNVISKTYVTQAVEAKASVHKTVNRLLEQVSPYTILPACIWYCKLLLKIYAKFCVFPRFLNWVKENNQETIFGCNKTCDLNCCLFNSFYRNAFPKILFLSMLLNGCWTICLIWIRITTALTAEPGSAKVGYSVSWLLIVITGCRTVSGVRANLLAFSPKQPVLRYWLSSQIKWPFMPWRLQVQSTLKIASSFQWPPEWRCVFASSHCARFVLLRSISFGLG